MAAKELSAVKVAGHPERTSGISQLWFRRLLHHTTLSFGGFHKRNSTLFVSSDRVLKTEPETRRWRMSIELFFKLMGLVQGVISNVPVISMSTHLKTSASLRRPSLRTMCFSLNLGAGV